MNKEKIVVVLLLITIILSIGSIIVTFSLNFGDLSGLRASQIAPSLNSGNVNLVVEESPNEGGNNEIN